MMEFVPVGICHSEHPWAQSRYSMMQPPCDVGLICVVHALFAPGTVLCSLVGKQMEKRK